MKRLRDFLKAFDPGWIRLEQVVKAGLAMVTAMAVMIVIRLSIAPNLDIAAVIYAFMVAFMSFMLVNDAQPRQRQRTMLLSALMFIVGPFVVGLVQPNPLAVAVVLLAVMFLSFYVRRYGMRAAELGMSAVMGFYFPWLFGATLDSALWFAIGAVTGIASAFFWQFVVKPFNPRRYLRRGVTAFDESAADAVTAMLQQLISSVSPDETEAALKRVHVSRRVIETQMAGLAGAPDWTREHLGQLRRQLFDAEQGLEHMATSVAGLAQHRGQMPEPVRQTLDKTLVTLKDSLAAGGSPEAIAALKDASTQLTDQVRAVGDEAAAWKPALIAFAVGGARVAQSVQGVQALATQPHPQAEARPAMSPAQQPKAPTPTSAAAKQGPEGLHPTTKLGIQAVAACGAAMLVAAALNLDRPYWAFWTAYIVVAGPVGESLQKIVFRVVGITLGSAFGTLLVLTLPNSLLILVPLQILALLLALYTRVINYAWMVFWITTFVALLYRVEGVPPATLLIERPLNTLIGASIAALVVLFVLPIRERDKFVKALAGYLAATNAYLGALVGSLKKTIAPQAVGAAAIQASGAYEAVAQTFSSLALETSPFAHGQLSNEATILSSLHADVNRFAQFVMDEAGDISADQVGVLGTIQGTIHENIQTLKQTLGGQPAGPFRALEAVGDELGKLGLGTTDDSDPDSDPRVGVRGVAHLARVNQSVVELGESLSAGPGSVATRRAPAPAAS